MIYSVMKELKRRNPDEQAERIINTGEIGKGR
jgi:hypothetical protein